MNHEQLIDLEVQLEEDAITQSIRIYRERLAEGLTNVHPGIELLKRSLDPMIGAIEESLAKVRAGRSGKAAGILLFLDQFEPDMLAFAALRAAFEGAQQGFSLTHVAATLGATLEAHTNYEAFKAARPEVYEYMMKQKHHATAAKSRYVVLKHKLKHFGFKEIKWGASERTRVGLYLLELVFQHVGVVQAELRGGVNAKNASYTLVLTPEANEWLNAAHAACEVTRPQHYPMVVPPKPWTNLRDGGYLNLRYQLVKAPAGTVLGDLDQQDMPAVLDAANTLQATAYSINLRVLDVLERCIATNEFKVTGMPFTGPDVDPPRPPALEKARDGRSPEEQEAVVAWKREMQALHTQRARAAQQRSVLQSTVDAAKKVADVDAIYFPVVADWRGRMYYKARPLNPQGDDTSKGLLQFAEARPLGENGQYWLAVHLANSYGVDKVPFDERVQWVNDNVSAILDCARDPMGTGYLWREADAPWVFLGACKEWLGLTRWKAEGRPAGEYLSRVIVSMDGSCNGLQHLSALLRDPIGGAAVNLVPSERPSDIYTQVARETSKLVEMDLADPEKAPYANAWAGKVDRSLVKRNTMTVPYAVTSFGMGQQLAHEVSSRRAEGVDLLPGVKRWFDACVYLADQNRKAIVQVVVAARDVMEWLRACAKVAAAAELPIWWQAPSGFVVVQAYRENKSEMLEGTLAGARVRLSLRVLDTKLSKRKQSSGVAPNYIHSMDAAHLVATVNALALEGVEDFCSVHDSFGVHAGNVDMMNRVLREEFVKMYSTDRLAAFHTNLCAQLPDEVAKKLPPPPKLGTLDLQGVLDSEYFFA